MTEEVIHVYVISGNVPRCTPHHTSYHYYALLSCLVLSLSIAVAVLYLPFGTAQQRQKTRFTVLFQNPIRHHVRINSKTAGRINKQQNNNKRSVHPSPFTPHPFTPTWLETVRRSFCPIQCLASIEFLKSNEK